MSYNFKVSFFDDEIQIASFPNIITSGGVVNEKVLKSAKQSSLPRSFDSGDTEKDNSSCVVRSLRRTKQTIYELARANDWDFFSTFTLKDAYRYDYFASCKKLRTWLNNFKKRSCEDLLYIVVPEFHKDGAIHFHALIQSKKIADLLSRRWCDNKKFYLPNYTLGISEFEKVRDRYRVSNYICKYITKEMIDIPGKNRYFRSQGLKTPMKQEFLEDGKSLIDFIAEHFPGYNIVYSNTGEFDSCYVQLKRDPT